MFGALGHIAEPLVLLTVSGEQAIWEEVDLLPCLGRTAVETATTDQVRCRQISLNPSQRPTDINMKTSSSNRIRQTKYTKTFKKSEMSKGVSGESCTL
jgi:hypothetical protein